MAGTRAYRRDNHGRFAGKGGGTKVTMGKAGGFANAAFRTRVQSQRASAGKSLGTAAKVRRLGKGVGNIVLGKPGSIERKVTIGGVTAVAAGSLLAGNGIKSGSDNRFIAGVALSLAGSAAVRSSPYLGGRSKR